MKSTILYVELVQSNGIDSKCRVCLCLCLSVCVCVCVCVGGRLSGIAAAILLSTSSIQPRPGTCVRPTFGTSVRLPAPILTTEQNAQHVVWNNRLQLKLPPRFENKQQNFKPVCGMQAASSGHVTATQHSKIRANSWSSHFLPPKWGQHSFKIRAIQKLQRTLRA